MRIALSQAVQIEPGQEAYLVVGGQGMTAVPRSGFSLSGSDISVDTTRITRGISTQNNPYAILPISVRAEAPPGARSLYVTSDSERAAFTGCVEIVAP